MKYLYVILINFVALGSFSQLNQKLNEKVVEAQAYCKREDFNKKFCFLIDMSVHSGKNRFYIYDFELKKITHSGLVCHGMGNQSTEAKPAYSNQVGSYCTSLGKYRIGKRAYSNWGINVHYKMHGLESSNSNAFRRIVVLHSYAYVPETEIYPSHLTMGWSLGCPVISNKLMMGVDSLLKTTSKPTLLWIFD